MAAHPNTVGYLAWRAWTKNSQERVQGAPRCSWRVTRTLATGVGISARNLAAANRNITAVRHAYTYVRHNGKCVITTVTKFASGDGSDTVLSSLWWFRRLFIQLPCHASPRAAVQVR